MLASVAKVMRVFATGRKLLSREKVRNAGILELCSRMTMWKGSAKYGDSGASLQNDNVEGKWEMRGFFASLQNDNVEGKCEMRGFWSFAPE
jgi:hypothetical protein